MDYFPKVSVMVPAYNAEKSIEECINSLLELNYPKKDLEIIVVNNASTDRTQEILNRFNGELKVLNEEKRGPAAARNKGILNAGGDFIAFIDADCVADKNWLKHIVSPLKNMAIGVVGGKILSMQPCNKIEKFCEKIHDHDKAINEAVPPYAITMNWASRLSLINEVGLFNESFIRSQDVDLSWRIFQAGYKLFYEPKAVIYHRNINTFSGLIHKGYVHGFHIVRVLKAHNDFVRKNGHHRFNLDSYKMLLSNLVNFLIGKNRFDSFCFSIFDSGKKIGKIIGSIRFLYLDI